MRTEWDARADRDPAFRLRYHLWAAAAQRGARSKLESLVRTLQLAADARLIRPFFQGGLPSAAAPAAAAAAAAPAAATAAAAAADGVRPPGVVRQFSDWEGFVVEPEAAGEGGAFWQAVRGLFPAGVREERVRSTLCTSGVVPQGWQWGWQWDAAWAGGAAFVLRPGPKVGPPAGPLAGQGDESA